jgi:hypothetical protein
MFTVRPGGFAGNQIIEQGGYGLVHLPHSWHAYEAESESLSGVQTIGVED